MPPRPTPKPPKEEPPARVATEFDDLPTERLQETIRTLKEHLEKAQMDRNQMQIDRDMVQQFFDITKKELRDYELSIIAKDREMELMEDNHRVEVRVYEQKVKHLEYEHRNGMTRIAKDVEKGLGDEATTHGRREEDMRRAKADLRERLRLREEEYASEIHELRSRNERAQEKTRQQFRETMDQLRERYEARLGRLREDLELRRKVEIHEVEERKNQHINDLMQNHERDFEAIRRFYNGVTSKNVATIADLKAQIKEMQEKQVANQALMIDISEENRTLADPLTAATEDVVALRADLRDAAKDRLALHNARARLTALDRELVATRRRHRLIERAFAELERERDQLYDSFEETVRAVQRRAEYRNEVLERKLDELQVAFETKSTQLDEALRAARLDPTAVGAVTRRVDAMLDGRNEMIRELQYAIARVSKSHNDAIRVHEAKLATLGIDRAEADLKPLNTTTSTAPAGLVARPVFG